MLSSPLKDHDNAIQLGVEQELGPYLGRVYPSFLDIFESNILRPCIFGRPVLKRQATALMTPFSS